MRFQQFVTIDFYLAARRNRTWRAHAFNAQVWRKLGSKVALQGACAVTACLSVVTYNCELSTHQWETSQTTLHFQQLRLLLCENIFRYETWKMSKTKSQSRRHFARVVFDEESMVLAGACAGGSDVIRPESSTGQGGATEAEPKWTLLGLNSQKVTPLRSLTKGENSICSSQLTRKRRRCWCRLATSRTARKGQQG